MNLPAAKIRQQYVSEVRAVESSIKAIASGVASHTTYAHCQRKLDELAERYQYIEELGTARFKLYELQALLYYFQNRDDDALAFIDQAIETKGTSYRRAEQLKEQIRSSPATSRHHGHDKASSHELPLQFQAQIKGLRVSAIIMAILAVISFYGIPWAIFYIILATKLRPEKVPSRGLIKGAAIATLPLCLGLIPILIDIEFWRMSKTLKEYTEKGADAFISDEEFLAGSPKRKKKKIVVWSIFLTLVAVLVTLIIVAIVSNSSDSSSSGSTTTGDSNSAIQEAKQTMESLRSQYDTCNNDLETRRGSVDAYDDNEVDSFNNDVEDCENTRLKLNNSVDEYNKLAGLE